MTKKRGFDKRTKLGKEFWHLVAIGALVDSGERSEDGAVG
jgi:hypothetical protein